MTARRRAALLRQIARLNRIMDGLEAAARARSFERLLDDIETGLTPQPFKE